MLFVTGAYYYWKHEVVIEERDKWKARDAETARQSNDLLILKQHEADQINKSIQERLTNAAKIYAKHYDDLRSNPIIERVFIATKTACSTDTLPGQDKSRSPVAAGNTGIYQAELPERNIRQLNEVISRIEAMQLKCEFLLNQVE